MVFVNTYNPRKLRLHYMLSILSTGITTGLLAVINPLLPILLVYDYFLLIGFTKVLNQTTFAMILDNTKRHIYLNRLNFLGYYTKFEERKTSLRNIKFVGIYKN
jgi:hypothetical protein